MGKSKEVCIVSVSLWDNLTIHCLSFIFGLWVLCKRWFKAIWDPKGLLFLHSRDNPPACLVDSSLGQHKYVKLKYVKLHYVESGSSSSPPLLLLHGFPDCWLSWRHQIPALAPHFRVIALDLKGFGDSDKPVWRSSYKVDVILDELRQFLQALGVQRCLVVGHDLGALLGWYLVRVYPEMAEKFIAVSCPHPNIYFKASSSNWVSFAQLPHLPEMDALKEDLGIISEYHKHLSRKDVYLEAYKYTFSRKEDWTGAINYFRNLPFKMLQEDPERQIDVPTVLFVGSDDKYVKLDNIVKSAEYCDRVHVKIVENAGHFPHQEKPEMFNETLLKYILRKSPDKDLSKSPAKKLMDRMFGAVTSTVKYGNSMLDSVQKKTNGVVSNIPSINLPFQNGLSNEVKVASD